MSATKWLSARSGKRVCSARSGDTTALPEGVSLGTLRVFGRSGDQPVAFPVVRVIADKVDYLQSHDGETLQMDVPGQTACRLNYGLISAELY